MNQIKIGNFIADKRREKKLTQEQLSNIVGVSVNAVSKWERGENIPDSGYFDALCDTLDITIDELFHGSENVMYRAYLKYFKIFILSLFLFFILIIFIFIKSLVSENNIIKFFSGDYNSVDLYLLSDKNKSFLFVDRIDLIDKDEGTLNDILISNIKLSIVYDGICIYSFNDNFTDDVYLYKYLSNKSFSYSLSKKINYNDKKIFFILVEYVENNGEKNSIKIPLIIDKNSN